MTDSHTPAELSEGNVNAANNHVETNWGDHRLLGARVAVLLMALLPALLLLGGLLATPNRPVDPIAVSTVLALFVVTPGTAISAFLMWRFLPKSRPLLRTCALGAVFSLAALAWVGDFWLIGINAGLKWHWLKRFALPTAIFIILTAAQWPRDAAK